MPEPAQPPEGQPPPERAAPAPIDIRQLAERVYRLMLADARLEQLRGQRPTRRKES
jgi:hypothetical protein